MNRYQLFALDMDGTLLTSDKRIRSRKGVVTAKSEDEGTFTIEITFDE